MGNKSAKSNRSETDVSHRAPGPHREQEDGIIPERVTSFLAVPNSAWSLGKEGREKQQEEQARAVKSFIQFENVEKFYEKLCELGEGAGGKVWKGCLRGDRSKMFAVKQIEIKRGITKKLVGIDKDTETTRELDLMLRADHPNLVKVHEVYATSGVKNELSLVMELITSPGVARESDLFTYVMSYAPLSTHEICKIAYQVADAIHYLNHVHHAMHRDLKPDNILIGDEGVDRIRVADYGHCNVFASSGKQLGTLAKGTLGYSAPEIQTVAAGGYGVYDFKVDVWSLGCILYMCASNSPAFPISSKYTPEEKR